MPSLKGGGFSLIKGLFFRFRLWGLILLFLFAYRILGIEGDQVLFGLFLRNTAYLITAFLLFRSVLSLQKSRKKGSRIRKYLCLILGTVLVACFLYGQANVVLDLIVPKREASFTSCTIKETRIPAVITGYEAVLYGINTNGYTKVLPLTKDHLVQIRKELEERDRVNVVFLEHVRRIVEVRSLDLPAYFDFEPQ